MKKQPNPDPRIMEEPVTYETYANMPDDGQRYEVADGRLELLSTPVVAHQWILGELLYKLSACDQDYYILPAPLDVVLSDIEVRQPDLLMVGRSRKDVLRERGVFGAPDLVIEITYEQTRKRDKVDKLHSYGKHGIPEYWILDLAKATLEQYMLSDKQYERLNVYEGEQIVQTKRIPCIRFTMNELFASLPDRLRLKEPDED